MALALTVSLTMVAICLWSTTVASFVPLAADRFGVDPCSVLVSYTSTSPARIETDRRSSAPSSRPRNTFSATVRSGTSVNSW